MMNQLNRVHSHFEKGLGDDSQIQKVHMHLCVSKFLGQKMFEEDWNVCFTKIIVFSLQCILPPPATGNFQLGP